MSDGPPEASDVPMVVHEGPLATVVLGPEPDAYQEWEENRAWHASEQRGHHEGGAAPGVDAP